MDSNEFFRNVTLRICGNLNIEQALHACYAYISQHIPADRLYLEKYQGEFSYLHLVARAGATGGERLDTLLPLNEEAQNALRHWEKLILDGELGPVIVINEPENEPVSASLQETLGDPLSSVMSLPLLIEGHVAGVLSVTAEGTDRYREEHAQLYATVKEPFFVAMSNMLRHEELLQLKDRLADENRRLFRELRRISGDQIIGADFGLRDTMRQVHQVAPTDSPVLLTGETGAGKDVIANAIHLASTRREGPFIAVNCGAIADSLIDSELFGHEKGAFTGAVAKKRGRFERAEGGTILLDEIGEMPMEVQVRLLRVLQNREIERVGGVERIPVDIRIIAATHQDLTQRVKEGSFREDLLFRLNVFPIEVPPLRERTGDIPALVQYFIERKSRELKIGTPPLLAPGALDTLMAYPWPGNVRELENVLERALILHRGDALRFEDLKPSIMQNDVAQAPVISDGPPLDLDSFTAQHIRRVLNRTGGKIHGPGGAGELLGINPNTLRNKMGKLGIPFRSQRESS